MIRNYLTSILRYVSKNKAFTIINLSGLIIGMVSCLLITQFVVHEFSYDGFNKKKDRIFRLQLDRYDKGKLSTQWAAGAMGIGPDLKDNFAEVEEYVRLTGNNSMFSYKDVFFKEEGVYYATPNFFEVFSIPLIHGTDSTVLKEPFKVVLSETLAKKYFGNENPIGKTIRNNGRTDFEVTGVFRDLPPNTHMAINALFSYATFESQFDDPSNLRTWLWDGHFTYILLQEGVDAKAFESKMDVFVDNHKEREFTDMKGWMDFNLQRLTDIHLDSNFMYEFKPNGNRRSVYFLAIVAGLILIIAWVNYVNLSTAKSIERAREVGVRKVMGGYRAQLVQQFLFEAGIFNVVAIVLSLALVYVLTPWFSEVTGRQFGSMLFDSSRFWVAIGFLVVAGTIFSGIYPSLVLSGYRPVEVLKGRFKNTGSGVVFRKIMVSMQFVASIALIVGTFTVYSQLQFMQNQELGVNIDQTLVLNSPSVVDSTYAGKFTVFKQRITQYPEVTSVTASTSVPGRQPNWNAGGIRRLSQSEDETNQYRVIMMDHDFIPTYGLNVIAGRPFSGSLQNENRNVLINESSSRLMGFDKPDLAINDDIFFWGDTFRIVGVVQDYHQESLKKSFEPLIFRYNSSPGGYYSIRFNTARVKESVSKFEGVWKEIFPGNPFIHMFLDQHYDQQYQADRQFGQVFAIFSSLAIFIACLGLFGLSSLSVIQRSKEIGVRKVLGASVTGIIQLVSRDYAVLLFWSIVFAVPVSWWIMQRWLSEFAYRIDMSWWIFAVPCLVVVGVALLTVSIHTLRLARTNPAHSLRYE